MFFQTIFKFFILDLGQYFVPLLFLHSSPLQLGSPQPTLYLHTFATGIFIARFPLAYLISPHFCHRYIYSQVPTSLPYMSTLMPQVYLQLGSPQPTLYPQVSDTGIFIARFSLACQDCLIFIHFCHRYIEVGSL